nr:DUF5681 domain-containing protein [uncultured Rhodoferax sp.]
MTQRTSTGRFVKGVSGNPAGPKAGKALVRKLLDPKAPELIKVVLAQALAGDMAALKMCLDRIDPPARQQIEPVEIPGFAQAQTLVEKAQKVIEAVGSGLVSPDTGAAVIGVIASAVAIKQDDQLAAELEALKAAVEKLRNEN